MINPFKPGDKKQYERVVTKDDAPTFETGVVHPVYSTFALARDAEWACRLFVLEMKEGDEEGIGTFVNIDHISPALENSRIELEATVKSIEGNEIICTFEAKVGERLIAKGETGQKILKKDRLKELFEGLT